MISYAFDSISSVYVLLTVLLYVERDIKNSQIARWGVGGMYMKRATKADRLTIVMYS